MSSNENKLPEYLYKYRSLNDEYSMSLLENGELYFASPLEFSDPQDCYNPIDIKSLSTEELRMWIGFKLLNWYGNVSQALFNKIIDDRLIEFQNNMDEKVRAFQVMYRTESSQRTGVLSFSLNGNSRAMWNDYAGRGNGFVVKIVGNWAQASRAGFGGPVTYVDQLPKILPTPFEDDVSRWIKEYFHKLNKYSYESEYRLVRFSAEVMDKETRFAMVESEYIYEVCVGWEVSMEKFEAIQKICMERYPDCHVYQITHPFIALR